MCACVCVYVYVCVHLCVYVCVCMHVCVYVPEKFPAKCSAEKSPLNAQVLSLSKQLTHIAPVHPAVLWDLAIAGIEANTKLCMYHLMVLGLRVPTPSSLRHIALLRGTSPISPRGICPALTRSNCMVHRYPSLTG